MRGLESDGYTMVPGHETIVNSALCGMLLSKVTASLCEISTKEIAFEQGHLSDRRRATKKRLIAKAWVNNRARITAS